MRKCIDSILAQTFTDFECLLIDDASTDGSTAICDEYAQKDARIKVYHKPNGGLMMPVNMDRTVSAINNSKKTFYSYQELVPPARGSGGAGCGI